MDPKTGRGEQKCLSPLQTGSSPLKIDGLEDEIYF